MSEDYECDHCENEFTSQEAIRTKTMGSLDHEKWQTFCCPQCGNRVVTIFTPVVDGDF